MTKLTVRQIAAIKNTAKSVNHFVTTRNKLVEKLQELQTKVAEINEQIDLWEAPVMHMSNGLKSENLVTKTVVPVYNPDGTQKVNKDGTPVKVTKYEVNSNILHYNEDTKDYTIVLPEQAEAVAVAVDDCKVNTGSDFDIDAEKL